MRKLELLSPARNAEVGRIAILAGADAVYIGAPSFGARAAAGNSVSEIASLAAFAHRYRAKVYVTMNTILYDSELEDARALVWQLYAAGVDALIVQDMAYLKMDLPPISLHASTQCDIRTPQKAARLAAAGFAQLVLPREFSPAEIRAAAEAAGVPVEVFVHGALCVSYSGDCQAGCVAMGRSANRGVCPQMCRLEYDLVDASGSSVGPKRHYLSLRDLKRVDALAELIEAGASSFKIEGRLKDARYVANVTAAYSQALDAFIAAHPAEYCRSSVGECRYGFTPDLDRTFNRGYTDYFMRPKAPGKMASMLTPKWAGVPVGTVTKPYDSRRKCFTAKLSAPLANGDGLAYFDASGQFCGFRLNRAEGAVLFPAGELPDLKPGTVIYRNSDKAFFDVLDRPDASCARTISVDIRLTRSSDDTIALHASDARGCEATVSCEYSPAAARTDQSEARRRVMAKLGDTIYTLRTFEDNLGNIFVPASVLAEGRRRLIEALDAAAEATYLPERRIEGRLSDDAFAEEAPLSYHDNVANAQAAAFYTEHGATVGERALEVSGANSKCELAVMCTRYCVRRELGACLRTPSGEKLPSPLFLSNPTGRYRLDFDCERCGMNVVKVS